MSERIEYTTEGQKDYKERRIHLNYSTAHLRLLKPLVYSSHSDGTQSNNYDGDNQARLKPTTHWQCGL